MVDVPGSPEPERVAISHQPAHGRSTSRSPDGAPSVHGAQANHVVPVLATGAAPRPEVVPGELVFQLPAHRGFVDQIGSTLAVTLALIDRDLAAGNDLEAALLTAATAIIRHARPWAPLEVSIAIDDTDAFVRLSTALLDPDGPAPLGEHAQATLRRKVESHEVLYEAGTVTVVLQVPLASM